MEMDINMDMDTATDTDTESYTFKISVLNWLLSTDSERFKYSTFQNCRPLTRFKS